MCVSCLLAAFVAAKFAGYNIGQAGRPALGRLHDFSRARGGIGYLGPDRPHSREHKAMVDAMPVAYAVTYLFGTAGSAWFLASIGPKLLRVDLAKECAEYEVEMGGAMSEESQFRLTAG